MDIEKAFGSFAVREYLSKISTDIRSRIHTLPDFANITFVNNRIGYNWVWELDPNFDIDKTKFHDTTIYNQIIDKSMDSFLEKLVTLHTSCLTDNLTAYIVISSIHVYKLNAGLIMAFTYNGIAPMQDKLEALVEPRL